MDTILKAELTRQKEVDNAELYKQEKLVQLELEKQKSYIEAVRSVFESITPELVASMTARSNAELIGTVSTAMGAYAIAGEESVSDVTNRLLRGTSLEGLLETVLDPKKKK